MGIRFVAIPELQDKIQIKGQISDCNSRKNKEKRADLLALKRNQTVCMKMCMNTFQMKSSKKRFAKKVITKRLFVEISYQTEDIKWLSQKRTGKAYPVS